LLSGFFLPVSTLTERSQLDGQRPRDDEVEEPLGGGRKGHVQGSEAGGGDLGHEDPACGAPTELEEGGEDEDEGEGEVAGHGHGRVLLGRRHAHVDGDVVHAEGLPDPGHQERSPTAQRVGHEDQEDGARHHLHDSVDARSQERVRRALYAEVLEDGRRVHVDRVGSRELLEDHEEDAEDGAVAVRLDHPHLLLQGPERRIAHQPPLLLELVGDLLELLLEVGVFVGQLSEPLQHGLGLLPAVLAGQVSRRLVASQHQKEEEQRRQALHGERDDVLCRALQVQARAKVGPEGDQTTRHDEELVHAGEQPADSSRRVLGDVDGIHNARCSHTKTYRKVKRAD